MKYYLHLFLLLFASSLFGQQVPQFSMYSLNPYSFNPAYAGLESTLVATGVYRQQWSGLTGAPVTQHINAHLPFYAISSGVGIRLENDVIGAHNTSQVSLSYDYHLDINRNTLLSIGFSAGYLQYVLDGTKLRAPEGTYDDPDFSHNDLVIPEGKERVGAPVFETGIFLLSKKYEIGVSLQPVFAAKLGSNAIGFAIKPIPHGIVYGAYNIDLVENLALKPSFLVKSDLVQTQAEISLLAKWKDNIFAGSSFRGFGNTSKDAFIIIAGLKLNDKTTLAYSFDVPLSPLSSVNRGSHELLLRYSLNKPIGVGKLPPIIYNPRFF